MNSWLQIENESSRWVCFFIWTDLEKCSIISLSHQWILCSEWVPSEWESKQLMKTSQQSTSNPHHSSQYAHQALFTSQNSFWPCVLVMPLFLAIFIVQLESIASLLNTFERFRERVVQHCAQFNARVQGFVQVPKPLY